MNWDVFKSKLDTALGWAGFLLEKPAQGFAIAINAYPKNALVIAVLVGLKAYF